MKLKALLVLLVLVSYSVCAMDVDPAQEKYEGNMDETGSLISVQTLPNLAKKYGMSATLKSTFKSWFNAMAYMASISGNDSVVTRNQDVITRFAALPVPLSEFKKEGGFRREILAKLAGARSKSFNYVFKPVPGYNVYVTGLAIV